MKLSTNTQKIIATDSLRVTERIFQEMLTAETYKTLDELHELIEHAQRSYKYIRARAQGGTVEAATNGEYAPASKDTIAPSSPKETLQ